MVGFKSFLCLNTNKVGKGKKKKGLNLIKSQSETHKRIGKSVRSRLRWASDNGRAQFSALNSVLSVPELFDWPNLIIWHLLSTSNQCYHLIPLFPVHNECISRYFGFLYSSPPRGTSRIMLYILLCVLGPFLLTLQLPYSMPLARNLFCIFKKLHWVLSTVLRELLISLLSFYRREDWATKTRTLHTITWVCGK